MTDPQGRPWTIHGIQRRPGPGGRCHFRVTLACGDASVTDVHLEASELLDYLVFRRHVLETSGRLVRFAEVETAADPAAAWLDLVETACPTSRCKDRPPASTRRRRPDAAASRTPPSRRRRTSAAGIESSTKYEVPRTKSAGDFRISYLVLRT